MIRRTRGERGQTTAMATAMLMALILAVAVVVNVGQAINRRVALQVVADTGAHTGASVMAVGMNHVAYWNHALQRAWGYLVAGTFNFGQYIVPPPCVTSGLVLADYLFVYGMFHATNVKFARWPADEARRVTEYNINELFPRELPRMGFGETCFGSPACDPMLTMNPAARPPFPLVLVRPVRRGTSVTTGPNQWQGEMAFWDSRPFLPAFPFPTRTAPGSSGVNPRNWTCIVSIIPPATAPQFIPDAPGWYEKIPNWTYYFGWRVTAPPTKAFLFDNFFGFGGMTIPSMTAVAAAKPVGFQRSGQNYGDIATGRVGYRVKMVPVSRIGVAIVRDPFYTGPGGIRPVTH